MSLTDLDYYAAFEVSPKATREEVLDAYHRVADNYREGSLASYGLLSEEERKAIVEFLDTALRVLSDDSRRSTYDQALVNEGAYTSDELMRPKAPDTSPPVSDAVAAPASVGQAGVQAEPRSPQPQGASERKATYDIPSVFATPKAASSQPVSENEGLPTRNLLDVIGARSVGGAELREMRESGGYSLEDVTATTKVSLSNLRFIESMDMAFLPAPVYLKGSLRSYATFLRVDPERVVNDYMKLYYARQDPTP